MYFYRVEFQQRGAPHIHSLLWLKNKLNEDAPSIWVQENSNQNDFSKTDNDSLKRVEKFAEQLTSTNPDDMTCKDHDEIMPYTALNVLIFWKE